MDFVHGRSLADVLDVLEEAEDRGHMDALLEVGFINYSVNAVQLERLPEELQAIYRGLEQKKEGSLRVSVPKALK